jgi:hypothetical protein
VFDVPSNPIAFTGYYIHVTMVARTWSLCRLTNEGVLINEHPPLSSTYPCMIDSMSTTAETSKFWEPKKELEITISSFYFIFCDL